MDTIDQALAERRVVGGIVYATVDEAERADRGYRLNEYRVSREYGGPEEGGWWYTLYEPTGVTLPLWHLVTYEEAARVRDQLQTFADVGNAVDNPHGIYSVLGGSSILWQVEQHEARREPERRPHYE